MKRLFVAGAVVTAVAAVGAAAAGACTPPPELGCGKGFTLTESSFWEGFLSDKTQGHVNGDGWVCLQNHAAPGGDVIVVDNVVPPQAHV